MARLNLLIGNGQSLVQPIPRPRSGNSGKAKHYTIEQARGRLTPQIDAVISQINELPSSAKVREEGVGLFTVHPAFLAKTSMPHKIFKAAGLRTLGSRAVEIAPEIDTRVSAVPGVKQPTAEIYVSGTATAFESLKRTLQAEDTSLSLKDEFCKLERIQWLGENDRLLNLSGEDLMVKVELVIHSELQDQELLKQLRDHAIAHGAEVHLDKRYQVPSLLFLPGIVPRDQLLNFAKFAPLRALRRLPILRLNRPTIRERITTQAPALPDADAIDPSVKVVAFDGGLGIKDFSRWAREEIPEALGATNAGYLSHGVEVTSALLFGCIEGNPETLPQPYFNVEHHRVIGASDELDVDLYECMNRIDHVLAKGGIDFINLSLGPRMPMDDDHPHAWTTMLDKHLGSGQIFATVAVGNDGDLKDQMGRVQPPADAVNALAVGSADSTSFMWNRASYSCYGPGRSPGIIKPDGLAFGGTDSTPLILLNPLAGGLTGVQGTSFGSPLVLRTAAAARAVATTKLSATALRALLIHRAERGQSHRVDDVGWGRFPSSVEALLTCNDNEATVLYQGSIDAGCVVRASLPIPVLPMGTALSIQATFCFASPVDAADPINYTQHGLTVVFRPRGEGTSDAFFSTMSHGAEQDLRKDSHKWETTLHKARSFKAEDLVSPCFDIEHGARKRGGPTKNKDEPPLQYVLILTITAATAEPVYQRVLQRYTTLAPIQLRSQVQLKV